MSQCPEVDGSNASGRVDSTDTTTTVLLVDDEPDVIQLYEDFLTDRFTVLTATGASEAFERIDPRVDIVILDRHMPGSSGDELLVEFRDRGYDVPVVMVTAVNPDTDIIDLPFDDYLTKPVTRDELRKTVSVLVNQRSLDETSQELYCLASKIAALEAEDDFDKTSSQEYDKLVDQMTNLKDEIDATLSTLFVRDPETPFQVI